MDTWRQYWQSVPHYAVSSVKEECVIGWTDKFAYCRWKTLSWNLRTFGLKM